MASTQIDDATWDHREHDWTGKTFYFVPLISIFNKPLGLGNKIEQLNREVRQTGYKILDNMILIQFASFKGRVMIEVEKQEKMDAQILSFEEKTAVDTMVYCGSPGQMSESIKRLEERVVSKRGIAPRSIYYKFVSKTGREYKTILFAIT